MGMVCNQTPEDYLASKRKAENIFIFNRNLAELENVFQKEYRYFYYCEEDVFLSKEGLTVIKELCKSNHEDHFILGSTDSFDYLRLGFTNYYTITAEIDSELYENESYMAEYEGEQFFGLDSHFIFSDSQEWAVASNSFAEISILALKEKPKARLNAFLLKYLYNVDEFIEVTYSTLKKWMKEQIENNYESRSI